MGAAIIERDGFAALCTIEDHIAPEELAADEPVSELGGEGYHIPLVADEGRLAVGHVHAGGGGSANQSGRRQCHDRFLILSAQGRLARSSRAARLSEACI